MRLKALKATLVAQEQAPLAECSHSQNVGSPGEEDLFLVLELILTYTHPPEICLVLPVVSLTAVEFPAACVKGILSFDLGFESERLRRPIEGLSMVTEQYPTPSW